jgi:chemotaxis methyl-accepting protein methylase
MAIEESLAVPVGVTDSTMKQKYAKAYMRLNKWIWRHLPSFVRSSVPGRWYGMHLHSLVLRYADRNQNHSTFFLRNRPEMELMSSLLAQQPRGASVNLSVVACSKGAEVYSILWTLRSARPDLNMKMRAFDISQTVVDFAREGAYSLDSGETGQPVDAASDITWRDQVWGNKPLSLFERMTVEERKQMFDVEGNQAKIKPWLKDGISWMQADATDPAVAAEVGPQDIVVANRFLCHMRPPDAEACLRNVARLVKKGGYLFVSGVDLEVRTRVARELGWRPVESMIREVHEGDPSLTEAWPLDYWGIEPFRDSQSDWELHFASAFQIG